MKKHPLQRFGEIVGGMKSKWAVLGAWLALAIVLGLVFPQVSEKDYDIVNTYLYAANNYGVTLHRLAKRTGNSGLNAQSLVQLSQSVRAWDALTRNQETLVRLEGSNLAEQNIKYITSRVPDYEPSIYIDIKKTLNDKESF